MHSQTRFLVYRAIPKICLSSIQGNIGESVIGDELSGAANISPQQSENDIGAVLIPPLEWDIGPRRSKGNSN